jgi:hypothetical protein
LSALLAAADDSPIGQSASRDALPLLPVHMARYTACSKVLPALERVDAGAGQRRPKGLMDAGRIVHIVPAGRASRAAKAEVDARMQAWHDMRESTRDNGPLRASTLQMGRELTDRERIYLGYTSPMPVADDGFREFYS